MKEVSILIKFAEDMIQRGNYDKAKAALIKARKYDSTFSKIYTLLGNVFYLSCNREDAIKAYLSSIHLQINKLTNSNTEVLSTYLNVQHEKLPEEAKNMLPHKEGMIIFQDVVVPRGIAHTYIDLKTDSNDPIVENCKKIYIETLTTKNSLDDILSKYMLSKEDYLELDENHYISLGRHLLIDNLKWDNLKSNNVKELYFK